VRVGQCQWVNAGVNTSGRGLLLLHPEANSGGSDGSGTCDGGWHTHVPVPSAPVRPGITLSAVPPEATGVGRGLLRQQLQLAL
jgi:hypothetical protein